MEALSAAHRVLLCPDLLCVIARMVGPESTLALCCTSRAMYCMLTDSLIIASLGGAAGRNAQGRNYADRTSSWLSGWLADTRQTHSPREVLEILREGLRWKARRVHVFVVHFLPLSLVQSVVQSAGRSANQCGRIHGRAGFPSAHESAHSAQGALDAEFIVLDGGIARCPRACKVRVRGDMLLRLYREFTPMTVEMLANYDPDFQRPDLHIVDVIASDSAYYYDASVRPSHRRSRLLEHMRNLLNLASATIDRGSARHESPSEPTRLLGCSKGDYAVTSHSLFRLNVPNYCARFDRRWEYTISGYTISKHTISEFLFPDVNLRYFRDGSEVYLNHHFLFGNGTGDAQSGVEVQRITNNGVKYNEAWPFKHASTVKYMYTHTTILSQSSHQDMQAMFVYMGHKFIAIRQGRDMLIPHYTRHVGANGAHNCAAGYGPSSSEHGNKVATGAWQEINLECAALSVRP